MGEAVEAWLGTRNVRDVSLRMYRRSAEVWLKGWLRRRVDEVTREDVARRFAEVTERHGRVKANLGLFVLGGAYRRCTVDYPGLRNPVERWKHAGGRAHRMERRRIEHPAVLLPAWDRGIRDGVRRAELRDFFRFGLYTGMRRGKVLALRWDRVVLEEGRFFVDDTKGGERLELPVTRQLAALLARRWEARPGGARWVFASPSNAFIALCLAYPFAQRLGRTADLRRHRADGGPLRFVRALVVQDQPHCPFPQLRGVSV